MPSGDVVFNAIPGEGANHLELVPLANTPINAVASSENASYPATFQINLNAIKPWKRWQALVAGDDDEIVFDKNQILNPGVETGDLTGWTKTGDVTVVASPGGTGQPAGTWSIQLTDNEGPAEAMVTTKVRAGEKITVGGSIRGNTGTMHLKAYIQELNLYLAGDGVSWTATPTDIATDAAGGTTWTGDYDNHPVVPAYSILVPGGVYTLIVTAYITTGSGYADGIFVWHWTSVATILGHNVHPAIPATELRCSDVADFATDVLVKTWLAADGTPLNALQWPTTWTMFALRGERWWKWKYTGTNDVAIWNGQLQLAQQLPLTRNPNYGILIETVLAQERRVTKAGADIVVVKEDIPRRQFSFPFSYHSDPQWQFARDRIFQQSRFGKWPTIMIHDDTDAESCALVRPPERFDITHKSFNVRDAVDFPLRELAFPTGD